MNTKRIARVLLTIMLAQSVTPFTSCVSTKSIVAENTEVNQWKGKRVAILGDSISDKRRIGTYKCWWEYLAESLGIIPEVYAINGNQWNGILKQAETLMLQKKDSIDAILIFAGTNDFNSGVPVGEWYEENDKQTEVAGIKKEVRRHRDFVFTDSTLKGRINNAMSYLKKNFPDKQIIILTPIHRAGARFSEKNIQPDEMYQNKIGIYFEEYIKAIKETANVWAVPVIDLNSVCGLFPLYDSYAYYFHVSDTDRLHPNALGHKRMAQAIQYQLMGYPVY